MKIILLIGVLVGLGTTAAIWVVTVPEPRWRSVPAPMSFISVAGGGRSEVVRPSVVAPLRTEVFRGRAERPVGAAGEARDERRFLRTRRRVSERIAEMLGDEPNAIERKIESPAQLAVASRLARRAMRAENAAHRIVLPIAMDINVDRLESGQFDQVSLVGFEAAIPDGSGRVGYRVPRQYPEFPEQFLLTSTLMLEGEEPILRVVRINPGESRAFDVANQGRMAQLDVVKAGLRSDLGRLDTLAIRRRETR